MYIWRGKNRRDKRNFLLGGEEYWGAPSGSKSFDVEDEILRHEQEIFHVNYFTKRIELLMQQYLDTPDGMEEVKLILAELSHTRTKESDYRNFEDFDTSQKEKMRKNIFEIFRMFSDNYSDLIDREGLRKLLDYLGMQMPDKPFDLWCRNMNLNEVYVLLEFDVFYDNLLKQMKEEAKRRNGWMRKLTTMVGGVALTNEEAEHESSLSYHFQKKFELIEAKLVLVDHAVKQAELASRAEYRIAHPSKLICEICDESFGLKTELAKHLKDNSYHREKLRKNIANEQRFVHVEKIFIGEQGRKLSANRLIFSRELDNLQHRVDVAIKDPFRPKISDPEGKRYSQQLGGSFVQGFDPKSGIRPIYSQNGMIRQHLAPLRNKSAVNSIIQRAHPTLQVVLNDLLRCKDDFIDTVSTYDTHMESRLLAANAQNQMDVEEFIMSDTAVAPLYATVRIVFNDFADGHIWIIGEFNGWKPEPMNSDMTNRTWYVVKKLCPGHYRYRFIINKQHVVDSIASTVEDESSPIGKNNVVMVTNTAIRHQELQKKKSGGITKTGLILPNETSNDVLKIGFGASSSMSVRSKNDDDDDTESRSQSQPPLSPVLAAPNSPSSRLTTRGSTAVDSRVTTASSSHYYEGKIMHISRTDKKDLIKRLAHINLRNCALFDDGTWAFSIYVRKNSFIVSLDLSYNYISDEGIQLLGLCLLNLEALTDLKLNGNGFGVDGVKSIVAALAERQTLTNLEMSNNRLGDDGMEVLCNFLHYNQHILHIFVDSCYIGNEGMECLHHALLLNNTLLSVSLSGNVIKMLGANRLCKALQHNASLKVLNLNNNPLGPEGAKYVGDMISINHTLEHLQIANVSMMEIQSSYGAHHICAGLAQNRGLQTLNLKNNSLNLDHIVIEFAEMLRANNTTLTELDLSGNQIKDKRWFQPDTSITLLLGKSLPSIETSLQKNRQELESRLERERNLRTGNIHMKHVKIKDVKSDIVKGKWSSRREWLRVVVADVDRLKTKLAIANEHSRIEAERVYIKEKLAEHMKLMELYLDQPPCRSFLQMVGQFIIQYVKDLPKVSVKDLPDRDLQDGQQASAAVNLRQELLLIKSGEFSSSVPSSAMNRLLTPLDFVRSMSSSDLVARLVPSTAELKRQLRAMSPFPSTPDENIHRIKNTGEELTTSADSHINLPSFLNAHISILMAMFSMLGNGTTPMMINPEQVEQLFQMLALPIPRDEVQTAVNECLVPKLFKIGLHKLSEYILQNAARFSTTNKMQRYRILSDMKFNPPIKEAHHIILDNIQHIALVELRNNYRMQPENRPLYVCSYCKKRFATEKRLKNHVKRGYSSAEHRRQRVKQVIHRSQSLFLQEVKCVINGVFFPAYYELLPAKQLPEDYFPQVVDKIGSEGRPFGVVEPNRTVRAVDVFGEYLHVLLGNKLGWLRYRRGKQVMLQPACKGREGFDWNRMHIQESITYYRVNDALPENSELKVRLMPLPEGEVCGYLRKNQVIECIAVIGDWIQVRYQKEDAAWIMWRTKRANDPLTNQTTLRVPVTINRPDRKATAASKKRSKIQQDDAVSVEQQHDDHFKDHMLSYEINGQKFTVNPEREKYKHISREKIEAFNEVRYGHTYKQVNPNEADTMELLILLPSKLQYNLITKDADPLVQLPSPSNMTEQEIFDYVMNKEGKVYEDDPAEMDIENQDWLAGEGGNRFGLSEKDMLYAAKDEEDRVEGGDGGNSDSDDDIGFASDKANADARAKLMGDLQGNLANSPNMMSRRRRDVRLSEYDFSKMKTPAQHSFCHVWNERLVKVVFIMNQGDEQIIASLWLHYFPKDVFMPGDKRMGAIQLFQEFFQSAEGRVYLENLNLPIDRNIYFDVQLLNASLPFPDFESTLTSRPIEVMGCMGLALSVIINQRNPNLPEQLVMRPKFYHLASQLPYSELKSNAVGQLVNLEGHIVKVSGTRPLIESCAFYCSKCQKNTWVAFDDGIYMPPNECSTKKCHNKFLDFDRASVLTTDYQRIKLTEVEKVHTEQSRMPRSFEIEVRESLVNLCIPGDLISVVGVVKASQVDAPKPMRFGGGGGGGGRGGAGGRGGGGGGAGYSESGLHQLYLLANSMVCIRSSGDRSTDPTANNNSTLILDRIPRTVSDGSGGISAPAAVGPSNSSDISFTPNEIQSFRNISQSPHCFPLLVHSLCPSIFGHDLVKFGLLLGLFGGTRKSAVSTNSRSASNAGGVVESEEDFRIRADIHVLVVGDPGLGKSQLLRAAANVAPRAVFVCGNTTTTAGLTVTISRSHGEVSIEAGALVLADKGICCIDELDKITFDHHALLEAMEQQSISIAKGGVVTSLRSMTTVLAAANPVGGHYNRKKTVCENLKMNAALLSRFDLIFILLDRPDENRDRMISEHILKTHFNTSDPNNAAGAAPGGFTQVRMAATQGGGGGGANGEDLTLTQRIRRRIRDVASSKSAVIPPHLLKRYIEYAKKMVHPRLTKPAAKVLQKLYLTMRSEAALGNTMPVTTRHLESLIRLSQARARMELRDEVTEDDAKDVVQLLQESLLDVFTTETGQIDVSRKGGMSVSKQVKALVKVLTSEACKRPNGNMFTRGEIHDVCQVLKLDKEVDALIEVMRTECYLLLKGPRLYQLQTV